MAAGDAIYGAPSNSPATGPTGLQWQKHPQSSNYKTPDLPLKKTKHMKIPQNSSSSRFRLLVAAAALFAGVAVPAQATTVLISGTSQTNDQAIVDFFNNSFTNVTVTYGDFSNYTANSAVIGAADVFVIGRSLNSTAYANSTNSASFNALTIPVVSFTSYVVRPDSGRWGWHSGAVAAAGASVSGSETTVTAAGATAFGTTAGTADWFTQPSGSNFFGLGTGSVGDGDVLATIAGSILAAHWSSGQLSGTGVAFGGERLLFNVPQNGTATVMPTAEGQQALINALVAYTPLTTTAIPEPSSCALFLGGAGFLFTVLRRRKRLA